MSVSAAISSANFEALEQAVTGKDNEVFSTILFDSYDDKRIEELLLLEALNIVKEAWLKYDNIRKEFVSQDIDIREDLRKFIQENTGITRLYHRRFSYLYGPDGKQPDHYNSIMFDEKGNISEIRGTTSDIYSSYKETFTRYGYKNANKLLKDVWNCDINQFPSKFGYITSIYLSGPNYIEEPYRNYMMDIYGIKLMKWDQIFELLKCKFSFINKFYSTSSYDCKLAQNKEEQLALKYIDENRSKYNKYKPLQDCNFMFSSDRICLSTDHYIRIKIYEQTSSGYNSHQKDIKEIDQACTLTIDRCKDFNPTVEESREFLLKRICERHAMNETLVQSMKKKFEIERLYYKMKDLYDEDVKLTLTINSKHEQLNSLQEDICAKKVELNQLDMRILQAQNDLEALAYHHKQMELATEINNEVTLLEDDKEALDAKRMHDYYVNFANDLKVYKFAFEHMREISMKLEQEKKDFEEYKDKETKALEDKLSCQYDALRNEKLKFDEECEAYELESTKWKSMQESKFAKYQRQIDNYDYVVDERDRLEREVEKLNKELKLVTSERDRYRTTIETLSSFRK